MQAIHSLLITHSTLKAGTVIIEVTIAETIVCTTMEMEATIIKEATITIIISLITHNTIEAVRVSTINNVNSTKLLILRLTIMQMLSIRIVIMAQDSNNNSISRQQLAT